MVLLEILLLDAKMYLKVWAMMLVIKHCQNVPEY